MFHSGFRSHHRDRTSWSYQLVASHHVLVSMLVLLVLSAALIQLIITSCYRGLNMSLGLEGQGKRNPLLYVLYYALLLELFTNRNKCPLLCWWYSALLSMKQEGAELLVKLQASLRDRKSWKKLTPTHRDCPPPYSLWPPNWKLTIAWS